MANAGCPWTEFCTREEDGTSQFLITEGTTEGEGFTNAEFGDGAVTDAVAAATAAAGVTAMTACGRWVKGVAKGLLDTRGIGAGGFEGGGTTTTLGVGRTALTGRCGTLVPPRIVSVAFGCVALFVAL